MEIRAGKHAKGLEEVTDFVSVIFSFFPQIKMGLKVEMRMMILTISSK